MLRGKNLEKILETRKNGFGFKFFHTCRELSFEEAAYLWDVYEHGTHDAASTRVSGVVACKGDGRKVTGRARIVLDPSVADDFAGGDILLAPMTSPEYVFVMKKAGAIITDTGGLTSHAAIVSRELNTLCIVGAKLATKVFKDGDQLEVDPIAGTATKVL